MTPGVLADLVRSCADDVLIRRGLDPAVLPARVAVQRPRNPEHGDYATNVALQTARKAGVAPQEFAGWLAEALAASPAVRSAEVAAPGFLNLRLSAAARAEIVWQVLAAGERFGVPRYPHCPELNTRAARGRPDCSDVEFGDVEFGGVEFGASGVRRPPEYDVQYAHARLASLARNAADLAVTSEGADLGLLEHEREADLICTLGEFPRIVASAAQRRVARLLLRYLEEVARTQHNFSDTCRMLPIGDEEPGPLHAARLALCQATRQVLANGLGLLGVSAPEQM